jgi:transcriptional regulator with XRE-family HTH domain
MNYKVRTLDEYPRTELIGLLIKAARKKKKHSQAQTALKLGVDKTTISAWERAIRNPKEFHFEKISKYVELPIFDLMLLNRSRKIAI